ncbi:MAG: hypothetical protein V2A73_03610, partial [Pseudomonadota bacterium]
TVLPADAGVTAVGHANGYLVLGFDDGSLQLVAPTRRDQAPSFAFEGAPPSAVTRIVEGPDGTVVAGYAGGQLRMWALKNGVLLDSAKLHGPVVHLMVSGLTLYAATELGDYLVLDLAALERTYCDLLADVWREVRVSWEDGLPVMKEPPNRHRCWRLN